MDHINLGMAFADLGRWDDAVARLREAVGVGDAIDNAQAQAEARRDLVWTLLYAGDLPAAIEVAEAAGQLPIRRRWPGSRCSAGSSALRHGDRSAAGQVLQGRRRPTPTSGWPPTRRTTSALDTKAVALAGLTVTGPTDHTADAAAAYAAARTINRTPGIIARALRQFDTLTAADPTGAIRRLRATLVDHSDAHS